MEVEIPPGISVLSYVYRQSKEVNATKVSGSDWTYSNFQVALPNSALAASHQRKEGKISTASLLGRFVPQLLHDWFPLHNSLVRLNRQTLLNPAPTEVVSRPWIEIRFRLRV